MALARTEREVESQRRAMESIPTATQETGRAGETLLLAPSGIAALGHSRALEQGLRAVVTERSDNAFGQCSQARGGIAGVS